MRPRLWLVALLVLLASCGSSAAQTAGSSRAASPAASSATASSATASSATASSATASRASVPCGPAGAPTLAANGRVRVYVAHQIVYGCSGALGHSFRLGRATRVLAQSVVGPVAVAGDVAAYGLREFGIDLVRASVVVRRLTDGTQLGQFPATRAIGAESFQSVGSLVVRPDGAVAWIGSLHSIIGHRSATEVHQASPRGDRVIDSGAGIDPTSLRLRGDTLSWVSGGGTRHATLP